MPPERLQRPVQGSRRGFGCYRPDAHRRSQRRRAGAGGRAHDDQVTHAPPEEAEDNRAGAGSSHPYRRGGIAEHSDHDTSTQDDEALQDGRPDRAALLRLDAEQSLAGDRADGPR